MGRGKTAMKRIGDATDRHLTFCTQRLDLLKKARELALLCDAEVAVIGFSSSGSLFEYAGARSMQEIIQAYFENYAGEPSACSAPFEIEMERLKEEVQRLEKEERGKSEDMKELQLLSIGELEKLESELACELNSVRHRKDLLIAEQRKEFVRKEQELLRENEILRNKLKRARWGVACSDEDTTASANSSESTSNIEFS